MPQKITPALAVRAAASAHSTAQAAPTARLKVPRGAACCHAFCFGRVIRHGSSCVLHPASSNRPPLHCITFHSLSTLYSLCLGYWQSRKAAQITTNSARHPFACSFHYIPFHFVLIPSAGCSPPAALCCARLRCRPGCGPAVG